LSPRGSTAVEESPSREAPGAVEVGESHSTPSSRDRVSTRPRPLADHGAIDTQRQGWFAESRNRVLAWAGLVGSALTLFSNAQSVLDLADWARWIVLSWRDWTHAIWGWLLAWIGIRVPQPLSEILTASLCFALLPLSSARFFTSESEIKSLYALWQWQLWGVAGLIGIMTLATVGGYTMAAVDAWATQSFGVTQEVAGWLVQAIVLGPFFTLLALAVLMTRSVFNLVLVFRRAFFVALIFAVLLGLNELSKLGLTLKPPIGR